MTDHDQRPLDSRAAEVHTGFDPDDPEFVKSRRERVEMIRQFLAKMDAAGNPGLKREFGSAVLQLTGQPPEHRWSTVLDDGEDRQREVLVYDDGSHGWADSIAYSRRPRSPEDEMQPHLLRAALDQILAENDVKSDDDSASGELPRG